MSLSNYPSAVLRNEELQNLDKAAKNRILVDKNKEKVMDMLKMNGPEYPVIESGRGEVGSASIKKRKLEIEDLAEKAFIIKNAREKIFELSMGRSFLDQKQTDFFQKQADPLKKSMQDSTQLKAINTNLARYGMTEEKILNLQSMIKDIVEAIEPDDNTEATQLFLKECASKISKMPSYEYYEAQVYDALNLGLFSIVVQKETLDLSALIPSTSSGAPSGAPLATTTSKGEPLDTTTSSDAVSGTPAPVPLVKAKSLGKPPAGDPPAHPRPTLPDTPKDALLSYALKKSKAPPPPDVDTVLFYDDDKIFVKNFTSFLNRPATDGGIDSRFSLPDKIRAPIKQFLEKYAYNKGLDVPSNEVVESYTLKVSQIRTKQRKASADAKALADASLDKKPAAPPKKGNGLNFGRGFGSDIAKLGNNFNNNVIIKAFRQAGRGVGELRSMEPKTLMHNLALNIASQKAGNTGVGDVINSIIDEMLKRKIISKKEHKKLWFQFCNSNL